MARHAEHPSPTVVLLSAYLAGSLPFSGVAARLLSGIDLREHGSGTVSGTGLFEVAGFAPLAIAGSMDVAKGTIGPLLAGRDRPVLAAVAGGATVAAHNWSPWLRGSGGRGISPALGTLLVQAPEGAALLLGGLVAGRLCRQSALGTLAALLTLPLLLRVRRGPTGSTIAFSVVGPMVLKRVVGNRLVQPFSIQILLNRILYDRETPDA